MLKRCLLSFAFVLLPGLLCARAASADPTYYFSYYGPFNVNAKLLWSESRGYFNGEDDDGDGIIELGELNSFGWRGVDYLRDGQLVCGADCTISAFQYAGGNHGAYFHTEWYKPDGSYEISEAGDALTGRYGLHDLWFISWTDSTMFSITQQPPPIPEPSTALMSLAGLALLGLVRRRRRTQGNLLS